MSVYVRRDSPFYWLYLPPRRDHGKPVGMGVRERTNILATSANRTLADQLFESRMHSLALASHFSVPAVSRKRGSLVGWVYVYFVTDGEQIKIGRAINVQARLKSLQTGHTKKVTILATFLAHTSVEQLVHREIPTSSDDGRMVSAGA